MADTDSPAAAKTPPGFPFLTAGAALGALFAFLFLMWYVTTRDDRVGGTKADAKAEVPVDPATKLDEVRARNDAALAGVGAKMPRSEARAKLLANLKGPNDRLPFPARTNRDLIEWAAQSVAVGAASAAGEGSPDTGEPKKEKQP